MTSRPLVIRAAQTWDFVNFKELWEFRDLLFILGVRDIKLRYRQTILGILWVVLQPLLAAAIFAFVFGRVARLESGGAPYFLFALVGMVGWGGFSGALTRVSGSLLQNPQLISKVFFPRLALPLATLLSVLTDLFVGLVLVGIAMAAYGVRPSFRLLFLPVWLTALLALALGAGLFASALTVRYRDVHHVMPVLVQLLFYATPVAYSATIVPPHFRNLVLLNPVAPLIEAIRWSLLGFGLLPFTQLSYASACAFATLWSGAAFFRHQERIFADVI